MGKDAGSYDFGSFEENQTELERLQKQATIAAQLEIQLLKQLGLGSGMSILDLASGPGLVSCEIAKLVAPGRVLGVDISADLVEIAGKAAKDAGVDNAEFMVGNVYDENIIDEQFDWIYARFLLQHLEKPVDALKNVLPYLKPGGKIVIADVDDDWLTIHPDSGAFRSFADRAAAGQAKNQGDRNIGRKFKALLTEAGFAEPKTLVHTVTSDDIGIKNFIDLTTGFKVEQVPEDQKEAAEAELKEIYELISAPNAWAGVGIFLGTATRA